MPDYTHSCHGGFGGHIRHAPTQWGSTMLLCACSRCGRLTEGVATDGASSLVATQTTKKDPVKLHSPEAIERMATNAMQITAYKLLIENVYTLRRMLDDLGVCVVWDGVQGINSQTNDLMSDLLSARLQDTYTRIHELCARNPTLKATVEVIP